MKARPVWLLTLPMLLLGETAAHATLARLAEPTDPRHRLLDLTAVGAALGALSMAALAWRAASSLRARSRTLPSWRLAGVPALAFLAQEHLERFVVDGHAGWLTTAD